MRVALLFIISLLPMSSASAKTKIDTTDNWHVLYNLKTIAEFNEVDDKSEILIKISNVKPNDTLTVEYSDDTPSSDYNTGIYTFDEKLRRIKLANGTGTFNPLKIPFSKILEIWRRSNRTFLSFYYVDGIRARFLFKLKFTN